LGLFTDFQYVFFFFSPPKLKIWPRSGKKKRKKVGQKCNKKKIPASTLPFFLKKEKKKKTALA
jgi:hypothetical protein